MSTSSGGAVKFYFDENVNTQIVDSLRDRGITVIIAAEQGLLGEKDDSVHLAKATELGCVLITFDRDLGKINKDWLAQGRRHAGIIFFDGTRRRPPGELIRKLIETYETKTAAAMENLFQPM